MHATSPDSSSFGGVVLALSLYGLGGISLPIGNFTSGGRPGTARCRSALRRAVNRSMATGTDFYTGVDHWGTRRNPSNSCARVPTPEKTVDIGEPDPGLPDYQP